MEFELDGDAVRIRKVRKRTGRDSGAAIVAHMRGTATSGLTTDQIMKLTRGRSLASDGVAPESYRPTHPGEPGDCVT